MTVSSDRKTPATAGNAPRTSLTAASEENIQLLINRQAAILAELGPTVALLAGSDDPAPWRDLAAALTQRLPYALRSQESPEKSPITDQVNLLLLQGARDQDLIRLGEEIARIATHQMISGTKTGGAEALDLLEEIRAVIDREIRLSDLDKSTQVDHDHHELMATMGHMKVAVFRAQPDSRLISVNQAGADILGAKSPEELVGLPFAQFYTSAEDREQLRMDLKESGQVIGRRLRARRLDGEIIWIETNVLASLDASGSLEGIEGFGMDVTTLVEAEEENRKLNQFLGVVIDNANVWLNVLDKDAKVVIWNQAAEAISGYGRDEVLGNGEIWNLLYPDPEYRREITQVATEIIQGAEVKNFETTILNKSGEARTISWHSRSLTDEQGDPLGSVALGRDITPEKALQQQLLQQERDQVDTLEKLVRERTTALEQVNRELKLHDMIKDRFLANISHELRTPLVSGLGYVGLILEGAMGPLSKKARKGLQISHRNLKKLEELIDDLLTFTQQDVEQRMRPPSPLIWHRWCGSVWSTCAATSPSRSMYRWRSRPIYPLCSETRSRSAGSSSTS